jgi:hypothetical protein
LVTVLKAKNGLLPQNIENIFPLLVSETINYSLRNNNNYLTIDRRTETYNKSFIPSATELKNA